MAARPQCIRGMSGEFIRPRVINMPVADSPSGGWQLRAGRVLAVLACIVAALLPADELLAQPDDASYLSAENESVDPPGRVGWLSYLEGQVDFSRDGDEARPAELNWPMSTGDRLRTDARGRAELRIGSITLRADDRTDLEIVALDDDRLVLAQAAGTLALSFQSGTQAGSSELRTPYGRIDFGEAGDYRVELQHRSQTLTVSTLRGVAYVHAADLSIAIPAGRRAEVFAGGTDYVLGPVRQDGFDDWVQARETRDDRARRQVRTYVSPEMTGAESLVEYGSWRVVDEYGPVWTPYSQPAGWAPYRSGRWAWVHPWGWTWIDAAPWGFAPFHYGRWLLIGTRWSWIPGHHAHRPVFAPALVVWVGGSNWAFSASSGPAVGWFPLGPREVYIPPRHFSRHYVHRVNRPHIAERVIETTIRIDDRPRAIREQRFRHRDDARAVTFVPQHTVSMGQAVERRVLQMRDTRGLRAAPVAVAPAVAPPAPTIRGDRRGRRDGDDFRPGQRFGERTDRRPGPAAPEPAIQPPSPAIPPPSPAIAAPERPPGVVLQERRDAPRGDRFDDRPLRRDMRDRDDGRRDDARREEGRPWWREQGDTRDRRRDGERRFERDTPRDGLARPAVPATPAQPAAPLRRVPGPQDSRPAAAPATPATPPAQPVPAVPPPSRPITPLVIVPPAAAPPPPPPAAAGSPAERVRESVRRQAEREAVRERRVERQDEHQDGGRGRGDGGPGRRDGAGQPPPSDSSEQPPWRRRLDQRNREERP